jgi:hypothetical protein
MISAPTFASDSSTIGVLALTSPPSIPWDSRNAQSDSPLLQPVAALAERVLEARVGASDVAVRRNRDLNSDFAHGSKTVAGVETHRRVRLRQC